MLHTLTYLHYSTYVQMYTHSTCGDRLLSFWQRRNALFYHYNIKFSKVYILEHIRDLEVCLGCQGPLKFELVRNGIVKKGQNNLNFMLLKALPKWSKTSPFLLYNPWYSGEGFRPIDPLERPRPLAETAYKCLYTFPLFWLRPCQPKVH